MATPLLLLGTTTLGSANATIQLTGLTARKYLLIEIKTLKTASLSATLRFNNDSGTNYAARTSLNGTADSLSNTLTAVTLESAGTTPTYIRIVVINITANEKIILSNALDQTAAGAANVPNRRETTAKWANTAAQITQVNVVASASTFATGTTLSVWGSD